MGVAYLQGDVVGVHSTDPVSESAHPGGQGAKGRGLEAQGGGAILQANGSHQVGAVQLLQAQQILPQRGQARVQVQLRTTQQHGII